MRIAAILAGILLLAIALAASAPAALLDAPLAEASGGRLRIASAEGTVWNGSGDLVLLPGGIRRPLAWHIDAWPLLRGDVHGTIAGESGAAKPAEFTYGPRAAELRDFDLALPMDSVLLSAGVPAAFAGAGGRIAAHVGRLVRTPDALDARLTLQWLDASLSGPGPGYRIALGDVRLDADGTGPEVIATLSNRGGDLEISGQVVLRAASAPAIDAVVRTRPGVERDRAEAAATALALVGAPDGQGGYRLAWPRP
jgi:general secretion pathway protein N